MCPTLVINKVRFVKKYIMGHSGRYDPFGYVIKLLKLQNNHEI